MARAAEGKTNNLGDFAVTMLTPAEVRVLFCAALLKLDVLVHQELEVQVGSLAMVTVTSSRLCPQPS